MIWLAEDDPTRIEALEKLPIVEYWHLLNRKLAASAKAQKELDKIKRRGSRNPR